MRRACVRLISVRQFKGMNLELKKKKVCEVLEPVSSLSVYIMALTILLQSVATYTTTAPLCPP
jgi:hypothetical protein